MSSPTQPTPDDEISLLDILVVLAENFWLLLLAPLAIGAITFGIVSFQPKTYESTATLQPRTTYDKFGNPMGETAAVMTARLQSPELQLPTVGKQPFIAERKLDAKELQSLLDETISIRPDQKSGLVTVSAFAPTPGEAQDLAQDMISSYTEAARPQGTAKQQIEERIAVAQNALAVLDPAIKAILGVDPKTGKLKSDLANQPAPPPALDDLVAQKTANETQIRELQNSLIPTMPDIVLRAPTLEEKPVRPKRLQLTAIATILSGLALTVLVFIRAALRAAAHDPEVSDKITRIRKGILLR
jgi:uncharacterized protein involved in exopolysaccharide biosynthesis